MTSTSASAAGGITDVHIHVQPWEELKPGALAVMRKGKEGEAAALEALMREPRALLELLDRAGIWRVGLVNYPSPDLMGFTERTNDFVLAYAAADRTRLLPIGGVHPRFSRDPAGDVDRLADRGIAALKIHPPHQGFAANAYTQGLDALAAIYRRAQERRIPVMVHTGTSIFPGARCKYGQPMELDDVAIDFPELRIVMAHGGRPLWTAEAFFVLRRHPNVWLDLSGIPPARLLEWFPRLEEVAGRVLWGTDWPSPGVRDMRANLDAFQALPLSSETKHRIAVTNSQVLFPTVVA